MAELETSAVLGTQQSPIDIQSEHVIYSPYAHDVLNIDYKSVDKVDGHFSEANFEIDAASVHRATFHGKTYRLKKIHFHNACEHRIDGKAPSSFELHLVHQLEDALENLLHDKLVIAAFFNIKPRKKGTSRPGFRTLGESLKARRVSKPNQDEPCTPASITVPLKDFVPDDLSRWFAYEGSLTSYPFTEDVTWILIERPELVSKDDAETLVTHGAEQEHREIQPLHRRFVVKNFRDEEPGGRRRHKRR